MTDRRPHMHVIICALLVVFVLVSILATGCSGGGVNGGGNSSASSGAGGGGNSSASGGAGGAESSNKGTDQGSSSGYEIPEFRDVNFDSDSAEWAESDDGTSAGVDTSHSSEGYFGVKADGRARLKLQVLKGEDNYVYDIPAGKEQFFPFQLGEGSYTIKVMQNVSGDKYSELLGTTCDVKLGSEFEPFLRAGQYADYTEDSACVRKARELAESSKDANDFITKVYDLICDEVTYDTEKAETVESGYIPEPDKVLEEGRGICFDYASLAASMLRSQGIPVKIIFGYVGADSRLYHAWNMYYTEESGWVAVEFKVNPDNWNRMDLTFSANGESSKFIGDGSNYTDVFVY